MKSKAIIYSLNLDDVQNVAHQELERSLSPDEIELVKNAVADKIKWYDVIAEAINENIIIVTSI